MSRSPSAEEAFLLELLGRELSLRGTERAIAALDDELTLLPPHPEGSAPEQAPTRGRYLLAQRLSDMSVELDAETGELSSWYLDFLAPNGDMSMPPDEALALAIRVAAPPPGAVLESAGYETRADRTYFRVRFRHEEQGLRVEGDFLEVRINGKNRRAFALTRRWRSPRLS
jgi:hypothetical protein